MSSLTLVVPGIAKPKGSTKSFLHSRTGKIITLQTGGTALLDYEQRIGIAARNAAVEISDGPVEVDILFVFVRPAHHFKKGVLRDDANLAPIQKRRNDLDKLIRAVLDGLTGIAYDDDSRVIRVTASKIYGETPETIISIISGG